MLLELFTLKRNVVKNCDQIKHLQEKKLRKLLRYAYENSVYYKKTFEESGIDKSNIDFLPLSSFPTIDKTLFLKNFNELITVSDLTQEEVRRFDEKENVDRKPFKGKYHVIHSSGSTGTPGYFIYDEKAWKNMLLGILRAALWGMSTIQILRLLASNPKVVFIAATDGRYGGAMAVGDGVEGLRVPQLFLDIKTPITEWINQINKFKPNVIVGYPSAIKILGELVENGEISLNAYRVVSCGEYLGSNLRKYIEETFHTEVINIYGASESLALGVEGNDTDGMILFDDMNVIEVKNDTMYLTSLYNFAQPLIRYRLSDRLRIQKPELGMDYPFTRASKFLGRNEDILWFENESGDKEFLHPLAIEGFCIEGLKDYQFQKMGRDSFEMRTETTEDVSRERIRKEVFRQMKGILAEKGLDYVKLSITFVNEILPNPDTGKKPLILKALDKEGV